MIYYIQKETKGDFTVGVYIVTTNYFMNGFFGIYSTVKRARIALEQFLADDDDVVAVEDVGNYSYTFTTRNGAQFGAEITLSDIDEEFKEGLIKEE